MTIEYRETFTNTVNIKEFSFVRIKILFKSRETLMRLEEYQESFFIEVFPVHDSQGTDFISVLLFFTVDK